MKLDTKRLSLYPIGDGEMRSMIEEETDAEMKQAYGEMLQGCIENPGMRIWYAVWLMELKGQPGTVVGDFCFKGPAENGMVEIGYGLREGFCGNGYMTETVKAATQWALTQPGVSRVEAEADENNLASIRVLTNCGYYPLGVRGEEGPRFVRTAAEHATETENG